MIRSGSLLPEKQLGSVVCVAVIEHSSHAKAKALACQICQECIDSIGLNGCGKKGVIASAKVLSDDRVKENRAAALDLMVVILSRMNGDTSRLSRICGPSLSNKAMQLLEERAKRREGTTPSHRGVRTTTVNALDKECSGLYDELPKLSLRTGAASSRSTSTGAEPTNDPFSFSAKSETEKASAVPNGGDDLSGAAASLRARLMKIREKTQASSEVSPDDPDSLLDDAQIDYQTEITIIRSLLDRNDQLVDEDPDLLSCVETMKRFHAALSKQQGANLGYSRDALSDLRREILADIDEAADQLTR